MIRLWVMSDLHAEFSKNIDWSKFYIPPHDVLVLAGDIDLATQSINRARRIAGPALPIIIVAGNHEHYGNRQTVPRGIDVMREHAAKDRANGFETWFLENDTVTLSIGCDRVRFIGATLWVDFALYGNQPLGMVDAAVGHADFVEISSNARGGHITPRDMITWHRRSRRFIERELKKPFDGSTVVVTHHLPSRRSVSPQHWFSPVSVAFASRCDDLLALGADLWVHGHTHDSCDYQEELTRVVCNPHGYRRDDRLENPLFDPSLVIEIRRPHN